MKTPPNIIWFCPKCKEDGQYPYNEICCSNICPKHNVEMQEIDININEYLIITKISTDESFLEAMIALKEKDIVEYQLKLSQFRNQVNQNKAAEKNSSNTPKCPTCGSTKVKKITATSKVVGGAMFGLFSKTARSQFKCNNCGYTW